MKRSVSDRSFITGELDYDLDSWRLKVSPDLLLYMALRLSLLLLVAANLLLPVALLTFATGFFPYKPFIKGRASYRSDDDGVKPAPAPFNKIIFMVVDALRR